MNIMNLTRTKSNALHYGFQRKIAELNQVYKNQPTVSPAQIGKNVYRFSNKKFATKQMLSSCYSKQTSINQIQEIKLKSSRLRTSQSVKIQSLLTQIINSKQYKKLYKKYEQMCQNHSEIKNKLQTEVKELDKNIKRQKEKYQTSLQKLVQIQEEVKDLNEQYYDLRRKNLELNCQLDQIRRYQYGADLYQYSNNSESSYGIDIDQMNYQDILQLQERMGSANVGLSTQKILKLGKEHYKCTKTQKQKQLQSLNPEESDQLNCCICCQNIYQQEIVTKLICNHIHHFECLSKWLKLKRFCPLCKQEIHV